MPRDQREFILFIQSTLYNSLGHSSLMLSSEIQSQGEKFSFKLQFRFRVYFTIVSIVLTTYLINTYLHNIVFNLCGGDKKRITWSSSSPGILKLSEEYIWTQHDNGNWKHGITSLRWTLKDKKEANRMISTDTYEKIIPNKDHVFEYGQ
jgi:hypothetical protein